MKIPTLQRQLWLLASLLFLGAGGPAAAEPPLRAARLAYVQGAVSHSPAGQPDWVRAVVNRPLTPGDRLWTEDGAGAELQVGGAAIRLGPSTSVTLLNLDDDIAQLQLTQGTLKLRVRQIGQGQSFEIDTPNLALTLARAGALRVDVDPDADATSITVYSGQAEAYGEGASYLIGARQGYRFLGTGLLDYEPAAARREDELDRWAAERDSRSDRSPSARYVSSDVVGYEDLDSHGRWRDEPGFGNVWSPSRVAAGWSPYRDGRWVWVDPWGWTWVDDAPWGYAVSHYGRWAHRRGSWFWVPGPRAERAVYAPALVAFVGGPQFQVSVVAGAGSAAAIGWFPLAPREVYRPSYAVGRDYFERINRSNSAIAPAAITNVYNSTTIVDNSVTTHNVKVVYVNQQITGAVVAVPAQAFVRSQPVARAAVPLTRQAAAAAPVAHVAALAPVPQSVQGSASISRAHPPARRRDVVARTAPPPPPVPFAAQQQQLTARPGAPIDAAQRRHLVPVAAAASAPGIRVVTTVVTPKPAVLPPSDRSSDAHKAEADPRGAGRAAAAAAQASKVAAGRAEATRAEATRAEATKAEATRAAASRAEATRAAATRAAADRASADRASADRAAAAQAQSADANARRAAAGKAAAAQAAASRAQAVRIEAVKADAARAAAARAEVARAPAQRARAEKDDAAQAQPAPPPRPAAQARPPRAAAAASEAGHGSKGDDDAPKRGKDKGPEGPDGPRGR